MVMATIMHREREAVEQRNLEASRLLERSDEV